MVTRNAPLTVRNSIGKAMANCLLCANILCSDFVHAVYKD